MQRATREPCSFGFGVWLPGFTLCSLASEVSVSSVLLSVRCAYGFKAIYILYVATPLLVFMCTLMVLLKPYFTLIQLFIPATLT